MSNLTNPIIEKSFAIIDNIIGEHSLGKEEYQIARRIIHTTADFEYLNLLYLKGNPISLICEAIRNKTPIITDVSMIKEGIKTMVKNTFENEIIVAVQQVETADKGKTRTETGLLKCCAQYPEGIYIIGNAPTALLALCAQINAGKVNPPAVIGVPVGFVSVLESKEALRKLDVPQIQINGNKGGSTVSSAIFNALILLSIS